MSKREKVDFYLSTATEEDYDIVISVFENIKAREEQQYIADVLQAMDDVEHGRNISGPYKNAAELIQAALED
jgi:hypothetical protein